MSYLRESSLLYANWKDAAHTKPSPGQTTKETSTMQVTFIFAMASLMFYLFEEITIQRMMLYFLNEQRSLRKDR